MTTSSDTFQRALGCLLGLATGDALGMPSQTLSRATIRERYGRITTFVAPFTGHPASHGLHAAQVTDDTEQCLLLAERLVASAGDDPARFDERAWAQDLQRWEADVRARGLRDLLGPSSKRAIDALLAGVPATETGREGTTNGAAMRIAPVGIATNCQSLERLVARVVQCSRVTHHTGEAIAAAAAVATVVSAGVDGASFEQAIEPALTAAAIGQRQGNPVGEPDIAGRIARAIDLARTRPTLDAFADRTGTSVASHESIPAAFGLLVMAAGDPWQASLMAANIGDDTDTIGAIAGAMAGACGGVLPADRIAALRRANALPLERIATDLLALRDQSNTVALQTVTGESPT